MLYDGLPGLMFTWFDNIACRTKLGFVHATEGWKRVI